MKQQITSTHVAFKNIPMVHVKGSRLDVLRSIAAGWDAGDLGVDYEVLSKNKDGVYVGSVWFVPFHMLLAVVDEHMVEYDDSEGAPTIEHEPTPIVSEPGLEVVL